MCVFAGMLRWYTCIHLCGYIGQCTCMFLEMCWAVHMCDCVGMLGWCTYVIVHVGWDSTHVCLCRCSGPLHMFVCAGVLGSAHVYLYKCIGAVNICTYTDIWGQCTCVFVKVYLAGTLV